MISWIARIKKWTNIIACDDDGMQFNKVISHLTSKSDQSTLSPSPLHSKYWYQTIFRLMCCWHSFHHSVKIYFNFVDGRDCHGIFNWTSCVTPIYLFIYSAITVMRWKLHYIIMSDIFTQKGIIFQLFERLSSKVWEMKFLSEWYRFLITKWWWWKTPPVTNDIAQPDTDQDPHHPRLRPAVSPPPPRQGGPGEPAQHIYTYLSAANLLIGEVVQSRRRPLLGPSPGWLLPLSHLRHY